MASENYSLDLDENWKIQSGDDVITLYESRSVLMGRIRQQKDCAVLSEIRFPGIISI